MPFKLRRGLVQASLGDLDGLVAVTVGGEHARQGVDDLNVVAACHVERLVCLGKVRFGGVAREVASPRQGPSRLGVVEGIDQAFR